MQWINLKNKIMITIKNLKNHFELLTMDRGKTIILHHLTEKGVYNVFKYVCHITKAKTGWYNTLGFEPTNNLEVLLNNIDTYYKSLKYNSEFYNPLFRNGYFEYMVVMDYMRNLGFKSKGEAMFILDRKNVYNGRREDVVLHVNGLEYMGSDKELSKTVSLILYTDNYSWVEIKNIPRNPDDIIRNIDGILKPLFLFDSAHDLKKSEEFTAQNFDIVMKKVVNFTSVQEASYKEELIKSLEKTLETLKA